MVFALLIVGAILYMGSESDHRRAKLFRWDTTLNHEGQQPFDTHILAQLMASENENGEMIWSQKPFQFWEWAPEKKYNYVFVGQRAYYSEQGIDHLIKFVEEGNNVFISSTRLNYKLIEAALGIDTQNLFLKDRYENEVQACIGEAKEKCVVFKAPAQAKNNVNWHFISDVDKLSECKVIGSIDQEYSNLIKISKGKGAIYIHTTPLMLTNYYLSDSVAWRYADDLFQLLPDYEFYWDNHASLSIRNEYTKESPLRNILNNESFLWAWWLIIAMIIIYAVTNARRKQRIIPIVAANQNSTIKFTETVGQLYGKDENHKKLYILIMRLFFFHQYLKYRIPIHQQQSDENIALLIQKSEADPNLLNRIMSDYAYYKHSDTIERNKLIERYKELEKFYKQAK